MSKSERKDETPDLSEDRLTRICEVSAKRGFIEVEEFIAVLTMDTDYTDALPQVWEKYRGETKEPKFVTPEQRFRAWQDVFRCEYLDSDPTVTLTSLRKLVLEKFGLPLPQRLTDTDEAGSVFDKVAPLYEKIEELEGKQAKTITEVQYKTEKLDELNKELKATLEGEETEEHEPTVQGKGLLLCKPGTKWSQITMTEVPSETEDKEPMFKVKTPEGERLYTFQLLGMHHKQKPNQPRAMWGLLKLFAQHGGFITGVQHYSPLSDHKRLLDKHLQQKFGINESIYEGHAKKLKGHKTKITFRSEVYRSTCESTADRRNPDDYKSSSFSPKEIAEKEDIEDEMIAAIDRKRKTFN